MTGNVQLRKVIEGDLAVFFQQQQEPEGNQLAAFTAEDPADWTAFQGKWNKLLDDGSITARAVLVEGCVAGNIVAFMAPWSGQRELSYWFGKAFWGRKIATQAVSAMLQVVKTRPLFARVVRDNLASLRILEKCGFRIIGYERAFANARAEEVDEAILELKTSTELTVRPVSR